MSIWIWLLVFCISIAVLVVAANLFITAAEQAGKALGLPPFITGVMLVGFGTSLPELISSVFSVHAGSTEIVIGNVIGSNIFNTFGVMGIPSLLDHLSIPEGVWSYSVPVFIAATLIHVIITVDKRVGEAEGAFLICFYLFFIGRLLEWL